MIISTKNNCKSFYRYLKTLRAEPEEGVAGVHMRARFSSNARHCLRTLNLEVVWREDESRRVQEERSWSRGCWLWLIFKSARLILFKLLRCLSWVWQAASPPAKAASRPFSGSTGCPSLTPTRSRAKVNDFTIELQCATWPWSKYWRDFCDFWSSLAMQMGCLHN